MKAFLSLFVAHYKQFVRDKAALFFTFLFPILFILIFGWAFSGAGTGHFDIGLVSEDKTPMATSLAEGLSAIEVFNIEDGDLDAELQLLREGNIDAVLFIPAGFGESLEAKEQTQLQVYYDPSQTSTAQIMLPILEKAVDEIDRGITNSTRLISLDGKSIQSHELSYIDYLVPGILGMSLMFSGIFGCIPIIQQRQAQIIKRLGCTPLRRSTLVFSELAFRMILVLITAVIIVFVGKFAFDVQMIGSWPALFGMTILGTLAFVSLGYVIAAFIRTEEAAIPILNIINFPMMFLSGTFFEVQNMPNFIDPVVKAMPLTYLGDALRQIMVDGTPLHSMTTNISVLAGWLVVCLLITVRYFRWD